ncbi:MAG: hypothetical protein AAB675_03145 [Patescibacteria group bacterium]
MKKSAIIFLTSLIVLILAGTSLTFADENGRGNEKKNENGAQVTTEGEFKIVENNNRIIIKIKAENDKDDHGKDDEDHDDHDDNKNEHGRDHDEDDDDEDDTAVSPTPTPVTTITPSVTPTETPTVTPSITPTENPTITPTVAPTGTQQQVSIDAKIRGTFSSVDEFMKFIENILNSLKSALL